MTLHYIVRLYIASQSLVTAEAIYLLQTKYFSMPLVQLAYCSITEGSWAIFLLVSDEYYAPFPSTHLTTVRYLYH